MPYIHGTMPLAWPYYLAQQRKAVVALVTLPLLWSCEFWLTWADVIAPPAGGPRGDFLVSSDLATANTNNKG